VKRSTITFQPRDMMAMEITLFNRQYIYNLWMLLFVNQISEGSSLDKLDVSSGFIIILI